MTTERGTFGRLGFVLAAVGSAIGLGNIWKFPYITYENDGGSFVLVYLAAILLIGAPIMVAEIVIGRKTQQSAVGAFAEIAKDAIGGPLWKLVGALGTLTGFVLLSYYGIIAGWTVYYFIRSVGWSITGFNLEGAEAGAHFGAFVGNGPLQIAFHGAFVLLTAGVVLLGVRGGIERVTKLLLPVLGLILLLLVLNSFWSDGFSEAIYFLFHVGPVTTNAVLEAVGHAFFTLSVGMGAMITYGSYIERRQSIPRSAGLVCLFDTVIAIMACIVMFSIIFSVDAAERGDTFARSAGILFTTLPTMFYSMPLGALLSPLFYFLVAVAALTSTISLLEVVVAYFIDRRGWTRKKAASTVGLAVFLAGVPSALSNGAVGGLGNLSVLPGITGFFNTADYLVSNWFLPVGGLLTAIFAGWFLKASIAKAEMEDGHGPISWFPVWQILVRFVAPIAILWILIAVIGGRSFA